MLLEIRSLAETSSDPSDYLMKRFDAIDEFSQIVAKSRRFDYPEIVIWYWSMNERANIYPYPEVHQAILRLEVLLGEDDPIWKTRALCD